MEQLQSLDVAFLNIESSRVFPYLGSAVILDPSTAPGGTIDLASICATVSERLHLVPPFRRRLVEVPLGLGMPYWVEDPDFDIDYHIRESAIPAPGSERQLADMVARTFSRPLDRTRPLWELWLVHGLADGGVALLTKFHHALADGVTGNEILTALLDQSPEGREVPPETSPWSGQRLPSDLELLGRGLLGLARQSIRAARLAPRALPLLPTIPGATIVPGLPTLTRTWSRLRMDPKQTPSMLEVSTARAPRTPFNGPLTAHRRWAFGSVPLDRCKAVKSAAGVTINDVVVSLCAGAIRSWLLERDALPDDPLVAAIPISVRTEEDSGTYGNRIGMMTAPIGTQIADPVERLRRTAAALRSAKERHGALPADLLTDVANFVAPAVAASASRTALGALSRVRPPINVLISNVPGPRESLYCAGAKMAAYLPVPPIMDGIGLNVTLVSYRDELYFGIVTDRDQIEDPWVLAEGFRQGLDELEAALVPPPAKRGRSAKKSRKS